jgi:aminoglycoside 2''-phosphotransferase
MVNPDWRQIESENRGLRVKSNRFLGEGWTFCAYLVNDTLVVRCPKRAEHWPELEREMKFLAFAGDGLPLAVPRYVHAAPDSLAAPHGYAVYHYIHGIALNVGSLDHKGRTEAADRLAGFLRTMHGLRPDGSLDELLPRDDARSMVQDFLGRAGREIGPWLEPLELSALEKILEGHLSAPGNFAFTPAVLHADFSPQHLLVTNESVGAVIDFADVSWGDPDYDFMYLFIEAGEVFVDEVARRYEHPHPEQLRSKIRAFAVIDAMDTILNGEGYARQGDVDDAWRRLRIVHSEREKGQGTRKKA